MTPKSKMSKRERAALDRKKRTMWEFNPITRVKPSAKMYNRKKLHSYE